MISFDLRDRTALITGAASGIGLEAARMMAASGAKVALNYLADDSRGPQAVRQLQDQGLVVIAAPGDVGKADEVQNMVEQAIADLGGLDLLVNNAGTPGVRHAIPIENLDALTEELWAHLLNVNLMGVFRCSKAAASALKASKGAIVNTASIAGFGAVASTIAYSGSKAAVINLTKNLARALAPSVRVNAVAPGAVDSSWAVQWSDERRQNTIAATPLKRLATPWEVAQLIVYLGFAAPMITGQTLAIDGGISI